MAQQYGESVTFLGIAGDDPLDEKRAFVERYGLTTMTTIHDPDRSIWTRFGVPGQPSWVFIDDNGPPTRVIGSLSVEELEQSIENLIA